MGFDEKTILKTVSNIKIKKKKKSNLKYQNENIINLNDFKYIYTYIYIYIYILKYNLVSTFISQLVNFYYKSLYLF